MGSNDRLRIFFHTDSWGDIGAFWLRFLDSAIKYKVGNCNYNGKEWNNLPVTPPDTLEKIWKISKNSTALTVTCNGVEVLVFTFSLSSYSKCPASWEGHVVGYLMFAGPTKNWSAGDGLVDTASDSYSGTYIGITKNSH